MASDSSSIIVLDFGSQYTQNIARKIREFQVYCEIHPFDIPLKQLQALNPIGLILSGGPASCYADGAPRIPLEIFEMGIPILGICYGFQLMTHLLRGRVTASQKREYGHAKIRLADTHCPLWSDFSLDEEHTVWMSHGDQIEELPEGFHEAAISSANIMAAAWDPKRMLFGVQFHPEVVHTPRGKEILANFIHKICGAKPNWTMESFVQTQIQTLNNQIGDHDHILSALSGGVDSSVASLLVYRAIGDRLTCVFVDNGLLREGEAQAVLHVFNELFHMPLVFVDAKDRFLNKLKGIIDPEEKRKCIGAEFIAVFEEEAKKLAAQGHPIRYLVQGTLYPDVIESLSFKGPSATIKSHHNVGGLPKNMNLKLIEPLRALFKDEVRRLGKELDIPNEILGRHPFPGPGLAVRILGAISEEKLAILRKADVIIENEIRSAGLYDSIWQAFAVLLPIQTVGVMGDSRTYESVIALRAVYSQDGMTADWAKLPYDLLNTISNRIINEVPGINRVVYDISSKPPSTIEWE